ncbi:helix-turn-helix transcriptional regulator [Dermatobacter hominis]|uniref:helix-turn-helix transcriptional regulator n=1 Tax=Dermatobacter hominis TaxID=2884263 RepID=UPI001D11A8E8|nr:helix-turn-helix transcriptional regulator [Dermatobacter hominis]UDY36159.1 helix-turn-helix transcriptional regulator [Dermatobacter hominis]
MSRPDVGDLLRGWRVRRRRSQLDLSHEVGVSTRHLSFVETGRSRPSPELVLAIADRLDVPLRDRNRLLLAAGYAPRYSERSLDDPAMLPVLRSVQRMLDAHDPFPGVVVDRSWDVVLTNAAASALTAGVPDHVLTPTVNVFRLCLHPDGLAGRTLNLDDWAAYLLRQLHRAVELTGEPALVELESEVRSYPAAAGAPAAGEPTDDDEPPLLVPLRLEVAGRELSLFTTLTTFGTPRDVTLDELAVELFFPADDATEAVLRGGVAATAG